MPDIDTIAGTLLPRKKGEQTKRNSFHLGKRVRHRLCLTMSIFCCNDSDAR